MARPPGRGRGCGRGRGAGAGRDVGQSSSGQSEPGDPGRLQQFEQMIQQQQAQFQQQQAQLAALTGMVQQLIQQQQAAPPVPPVVPPVAPVDPPPVAPPVVPAVAAPECVAEPPAAPVPPPAGPVSDVAVSSRAAPRVAAAPVVSMGVASAPAGSISSTFYADYDPAADQAEKARAKAVLLEFKKFKPRVFEGKDADHWAVEQWIDHMEKLFQDLYTENRDKLHIAVHCLEDRASKWWRRHRDRHFVGQPGPTWEDFKSALYHHYLKETTKEGLERELENIKQGDKTVREYEQEFSRIADLVPQAVREERRKVRLFSQGLRHEIRRQLSSHLTTDFDNCVERCLSIEADILIFRAERDATGKGNDKKRNASRDKTESSNSGKPPKHSRSQGQAVIASTNNQQREPRPCIFCGSPHYAKECPHRHGCCFKCGQRGHIQENCPQKSAPGFSTAPIPAIPYQRQGTSSNAASSGHPPSSHQSEGARQASGGRVYALAHQEDPPVENPTDTFVVID